MVLNICSSVSKTLSSILVMPERKCFFFFLFLWVQIKKKSRFSSSLLPNPLSRCFTADLKSLVGPFCHGTGRASLPSPSTLPATFLMAPRRQIPLDVHWPGYNKHEANDPYIIFSQYSLRDVPTAAAGERLTTIFIYLQNYQLVRSKRCLNFQQYRSIFKRK